MHRTEVIEVKSAKSLLLSFGYYRKPEDGDPPFSPLPDRVVANKILIRDVYSAWYQREVESLLEEIKELMKKFPQERVVAFGGSMGGFGALLFGSLLGVQEVVAFSPQTNINRNFCTAVGDYRVKTFESNVYPVTGDEFYDVKRVMKKNNRGTAYHVYYSRHEPIDVGYAIHVNDVKNVYLHPRGEEGHHLLVQMRDSGELYGILNRAVCTEN